jgi:transcriptional regulator with XRE-family HTH domain
VAETYGNGPPPREAGIRSSTLSAMAAGRAGSGSVARVDLRQAVGRVLRRVRLERQLTLDDVRRLSGGGFKPSALGGYERGERGLSLARFRDLAGLYRVPPDRLLADVLRAMEEPSRSRVVVDLNRLSVSEDPEARLVAEFVRDMRARRGDYDSAVITLRAGDLETLAGTIGLPGLDLVERLPEVLRLEGSADDRRASPR